MTRLIGITGKKGSGKDALAAALSATIPNTSRIAFADALKRTAMQLYDLSYAQCFGSIESKETIDPRWGMSPREILQRIGTDAMRKQVHPETWLRALLRAVEEESRGRRWFYDPVACEWMKQPIPQPWPTTFLVPDVRFLNEARCLHDNNGVVVRVVRPTAQGAAIFSEHASETEMEQIEPDFTVLNNRGLSDLQAKALNLAQDLFSSTPTCLNTHTDVHGVVHACALPPHTQGFHTDRIITWAKA